MANPRKSRAHSCRRQSCRPMEPRMTEALSRRSLLHGYTRSVALPRPPGAGAAGAFAAACTQCGDCAQACPEEIILRDREGFPVLDMQEGSCSFCGACTEACTPGALVAGRAFAWRATAGAACLSRTGTGCRICEDQCDAAAIRFRPLLGGRAEPIFDDASCTGCGACIAPCPAGAIALHPFDLPHPSQTELAPC